MKNSSTGAARPDPSPGTVRIFDPDNTLDGLAALALLLSLSLKWCNGDFRTRGSTAATLDDVLLVTLLSVASVAAGWLWRHGMLRKTVSARGVRIFRVLANMPYTALVLFYLFRTLVEDPATGVQWLGPAVAIGLGGAVLAAQPRRAELDAADLSRDRRWTLLPLGAVIVAAATTLLQSIGYFERTRSARFISGAADPEEGFWLHLAGSVSGAGSVLMLAAVAVMVLRGSDVWRRTGVALGLGGAFLTLLSVVHVAIMPNIYRYPEFSVMFWPALGAAVSGPALARFTERSGPVPANRLTMANPVLVLTLIASGTLGILSVLALIQISRTDYSYYPDDWKLTLAFAVLLSAAALAVPRIAARRTPPSYAPGRVLAAGMFVLSWLLAVDLIAELLAGKGQGSISLEDAYYIAMVLTWVLPFALLALLPFTRPAKQPAPADPQDPPAGREDEPPPGAP